ncbi:NAD(P)H-dependent oxidoreductase [Rhizosphaericola mali]|uniref:NAD(P)H-dependent oxidoreductase n=1 Tax=Rhizosphaericola mali TaxID=2545455 RepID=A0A5P2G104_9BACT|nr:NAD(P)H-dependent oxidoreductase [Rhizosphaericola mali]QES88348.1 NAD(P)H-dependent oxidoreductase [Rhizosphaericola mali]
MNLKEDLNWRYAVKAYSDQKVSDDKIDFILEAINLTASSCGLQPYRVFAIDNKEIQAKLGEGSFNKQIATASHLLVFAGFNQVTTQRIQNMIDLMAQTRGIPVEALKDFSNTLVAHFGNLDENLHGTWADKQAYIAVGTALIAAANVRVDATPMEGFNPQQIDEILGLKEKGLHSTVVVSLGYRDSENDYLANAKKVRIPLEEMATKIR